MSELAECRFIVRDRQEVREYIRSGSPWQPVVLGKAFADLDAAVQQLADLGLTNDDLRESLLNALFDVEWPAETVRRMYADEAAGE